MDLILGLQEADARNRALIERVPVGVVLHRGGRILFANSAAAAVTRVAGAEALIGRNIADFLVEEADREVLRQRFHDVEFGSGEAPPARFRFRAATGGEVMIEARSVRVALDGEITVLTIWNDITERTRAERELMESERRFRSLTELTADWYWEQDSNFRFTRVEGSVLAKHGIDTAWFLGKTRWEIGFDNVSEAQWRVHRALLEAHRPFLDFEGHRHDASGRLANASLISGQPIFDAGGRFVGYRGVGRDITDRKRAEEALRESQVRLELALAASGLALFDWNVQTDEMLLSAEWALIVGGPPGPRHATGAAMRARVHPEDERATLAQVAALLKGEIPFYDVEHRVRTDGGEWRWILSRAQVTRRDATGRALRVTGTNADISYRKEVERLKDELIGSVSHELRTPLTSMLASLALLREGRGGALPEQAASFVALACENGERLHALVNAILDFERVEAGTMRLHAEPVNVAHFMHRALALNAPLAERYRVRLRLDVPQGLPSVEADPERFLQVITNLLSNAAKFSVEGGEVRVAVRAMNGWVRISVADDGCGIDEAFHDHIFKRFARAPGAEGPRKGGTGLGLAISKALVERMGGRISFVSQAGRGATFSVDLPVA